MEAETVGAGGKSRVHVHGLFQGPLQPIADQTESGAAGFKRGVARSRPAECQPAPLPRRRGPKFHLAACRVPKRVRQAVPHLAVILQVETLGEFFGQHVSEFHRHAAIILRARAQVNA